MGIIAGFSPVKIKINRNRNKDKDRVARSTLK
jgi:hypothetical protein